MDLQEELRKIKSQLESGLIDENEYDQRQKSIVDAWVGKPNSNNTTETTEPSYNTSLYAVLQLESNATDAEIRSKYRKLAKDYHPDKNGGIETPEWNKLIEAYEILSDNNKRALYDRYGIVINESSKFNAYVGGDSWLPYIGNLEIGLWFSSVLESESSPKLKIMNRSDEKKRRYAIRISQIVCHLREKLLQFPKQDDQSLKEFELFIKQEAQKLSMEPNGKMLLSLLGWIYISKSQDYLPTISNIWNKCLDISSDIFGVATGLFFNNTMAKFKNKSSLNHDEINKIVWRLSQSEISSIIREVCDNVLNSNQDERHHLANGLQLLGKIWIEVGAQ
ncbi:16341_t:CDS:2 [Dentiscutata erythropus]|uniref:16341_t:CDS:1 n=1 Tax=Dentiscutata erythropus TaxID=1348616 RepID=A0A9N9DLP3_9GLOM|nr:16341_t:CDS:2 [Dentiscutata erythropus]